LLHRQSLQSIVTTVSMFVLAGERGWREVGEVDAPPVGRTCRHPKIKTIRHPAVYRE